MSHVPTDATHRSQSNGKFYKFSGELLLVWSVGKWFRSLHKSGEDLGLLPLLHQPDPQLPGWTGEGPPPAGTVCEWKNPAGEWVKAEVRYISEWTLLLRFEKSPFADDSEDLESAFDPEDVDLRPLRAEADERMACAKEFHCLVYPEGKWHKLDDDAREAWASIYDANYRKQVAP